MIWWPWYMTMLSLMMMMMIQIDNDELGKQFSGYYTQQFPPLIQISSSPFGFGRMMVMMMMTTMISRHDRKCDVYLCENLIMNNGKRIELSFSLSWCYHRNYHQLGHYGPHWKKNPQKHLLPLVRRMMMMIMMMMMIIIMMMIMMMMTMALTSSCASTWRGRSQEAWALEVASPDSTLIFIYISWYILIAHCSTLSLSYLGD